MLRKTWAGIFTAPAVGKTGSVGKFERAMPTILVFDRPQRMLTQWFSSSLIVMSASGSSFTYSNSFRAGIVHEPSFFTFALHEVRRLRSRSVAVSDSRSPPASNKYLEGMGSGVLGWTTPWVAV